jgi:ribosomal protein S3AE
MSQSLVPKVDRGSSGVKSLMRRWKQRIETTIAVTSELHLVGVKILYGEAIRIEFDRHSIVTG